METPSYALGTAYVLHGEKDYYNFRFLNKGGYGITYLANATFYDGNIKQTGTYAIKEYYPNGIAQRHNDGSVSAVSGKQREFAESFDEFEQEGEMLKNISHPGIVPVNEIVKTNGTIYYVMSYLGEMSLVNYVQNQGGHLSESETRRVIGGLLDAVGHLHSKQLNHLDIKPDNVMMEQGADGLRHPVLIDFGLSKHFKPNGKQTSRLGGMGVTDGYSPLEQYAGISIFSPQADIYALGATLFYMLTGHAPKKANEVQEDWIRKNLPSGISKDLGDAICRAMERDLDKRTAKVSAFFPHGGTIKLDPNHSDSKPSGLYMKLALGAVALVIIVLLVKLCGSPTSSPSTPPVVDTAATETIVTPPVEDSEETSHDDSTEGMNNTPANGNTTNTVNNSNTNSTGGVNNSSNSPASSNSDPAGGDNGGGSSQNDRGTPEEVNVTTGQKDLGYARYEGGLKNGQPDGMGTLTFQESHAIDSRASDKVAGAGDVIKGKFQNGHLIWGTWTKTSGEAVKVSLGQ